jgi:hypothetical protein
MKSFAGIVVLASIILPNQAWATACDSAPYYAYPNGIGAYPTATLAAIGGWPLGRPSEDYEWTLPTTYVIGTSAGGEMPWQDVTSGTLWGRYIVSPSYHRAWVDTGSYPSPGSQFRMVFMPKNASDQMYKIGSSSVSTRFNIAQREAPGPGEYYQGVDLFARYVDSYNLYTAAIWTNGDVVVKRKFDSPSFPCTYTELLRVRLMRPNGVPYAGAVNRCLGAYSCAGEDLLLNTWYTLRAAVQNTTTGVSIKVFVDDVLQGEAFDSSAQQIRYGAAGIRIDYVDAWVDDSGWVDIASSGSGGNWN